MRAEGHLAECGSVCVCVWPRLEKRDSHLKDMNDLTQKEITGMTINAVQACHTLPKLTLLIFSLSAISSSS